MIVIKQEISLRKHAAKLIPTGAQNDSINCLIFLQIGDLLDKQ
jgi:hypothetical protein